MRLAVIFLVVFCVFLPSGSESRDSAGMTQNPPPGTYWDGDARCFGLERPIPVLLPHSPLLKADADTVFFDGDTLYVLYPELPDYFVLTKMPNACTSGKWTLSSILLACFNFPQNPPDSGEVVLYAHRYGEKCKGVTSKGDSVGDEILRLPFVGEPYDPYFSDSLPKARWTQVDLDTPIVITDTLYWVAWDYRPREYGNSYYMMGNMRCEPVMTPDDSLRFCEWFGSPCPVRAYERAVWMVRAIGHCGPVGIDESHTPQILVPGNVDLQICPNPATNSVSVKYALYDFGKASLTVVDVTGKVVAVIADGIASPGQHVAFWNGMDRTGMPVPAGIYFFRLEAEGLSSTTKTVLLR
jgi:hypothetical protein